jgi:hypothetical protein
MNIDIESSTWSTSGPSVSVETTDLDLSMCLASLLTFFILIFCEQHVQDGNVRFLIPQSY